MSGTSMLPVSRRMAMSNEIKDAARILTKSGTAKLVGLGVLALFTLPFLFGALLKCFLWSFTWALKG